MNDADYTKEFLKILIPKKRSKDYAYKMGIDCAKNGATQKNCHFSIFSTEEKMREWERGKKDGEHEKPKG